MKLKCLNRFLLAVSVASLTVSAAKEKKTAKEGGKPADSSTSPPVFFLQDLSDGLCLAGEDFRRCSIDTLFYVVGKPGQYQVHKRPTTLGTGASDQLEEEGDGICITKKTCTDNAEEPKKPQDLKLGKCTHCGAKGWNIMGDTTTGYILTEGDGKLCVKREEKTKKAVLVPCISSNRNEVLYTTFQLQFAYKADIEVMGSPAARFITAAADGDKKAVQNLLKSADNDEKLVNSRDWDHLSPLAAASSGGHLDIVKLLIKEGAEINAKDKDSVTALMEAALKGYTKVVETLLSSGAEVDATAQSGISALFLAANSGHVDVVKLLLKAGANPKNSRADGVSALATAAAAGYAEVVKMLIDAGCDGTEKTVPDGLSPLMNAAESGSVETLKVIMNYIKKNSADPKAEINHLSSNGLSALILASANSKKDAVIYLIDQGAELENMHDTGINALMYAAAMDSVEIVKILLEKGADINKQHANGGTALLEASAVGAKGTVALLLESGAVYKTGDDDNITPIMTASSQGHTEIVQMLIEKLKADGMTDKELIDYLNVPSHSGGTPVMFAAHFGSYNVTKYFIELGVEINMHAQATPAYLEKYAKQIADGQIDTKDPNYEPHVDGVTALTVATQKGHLEVVKLLLEHGADVQAKDDEDRTALLMAVTGNHGELATLLVSKGADPNTVYVDEEGASHNLLMDAIIVENEEFASLLITKGADIYYVDDTSVSTLLQASHRGLEKIVGLLLEKHALASTEDKESIQSKYIDFPSSEGITPLIAAASEGHAGILKMLIAAKASLNAQDKDGTTALMAASARGHFDVVSVLLAAGANINDQNDDGHTALMFAYNGKTQVETLWERYSQLLLESKTEGTDDEADVTGPIIAEALSNHTKLIGLLVEKGADPNLKDKEGHIAVDFDFHPDLDGEVMEKEAQKEKTRDESKNEL
mmetsp:Transcript_27117/g.38869  ORF Transcript_27117/g.38869 Transcript_27117/m.38869 type:complete len:938 (-) Transcript_27117:892-3705(-)|eukprot:CAMPEP_0172426694 /NCGR_PEP_ID=MMETSP1064-20121228/38655_1 /TAXON_ID=202472 /ORGANISM="Aulacoseira subarctica , Strain CCAP 1002/5" /LENGTH=937 /DNA_ID=CAMNT_0013170437 /DNA_START=156 /DNA_END=2969 /DNA_ORIENTATION=-